MMDCLLDLHLHLDGSLSAKTVRLLAREQGLSVPESHEKLEDLLSVSPNCKDLNEYLTKFEFPLSLLQTQKAIETAVYYLEEELKAQGLMYAEIRFAPQLHTRKGLTQKQVVQAALSGNHQSKFHANLILCCMRAGDNREANLETIRLAHKYLGQGVVLADLAGGEALWPNKHFTEEFILARTLGVPFTLHAGEALGPESVESALDMGAVRIGHGVRAVEKPELLARLAKEKIPLELCPTSNLNTNVFSHISQYPLRTLMEAGVRVTVNTDNLSVSNTTIREEWHKLAATFNLTEKEIYCILADSIEASFANSTTKQAMRDKLSLK